MAVLVSVAGAMRLNVKGVNSKATAEDCIYKGDAKSGVSARSGAALMLTVCMSDSTPFHQRREDDGHGLHV